MAQIKQAVGYCVKSAIFSQGSVATRLMCGGIFNDIFITCFIYCRVWRWKNFENRSAFREVGARV